MAYVVGVMLLLLVAAMVVKYVGGHPFLVRVVAPIHGFLYIAYLVVALDLASKARWSLGRTVLVLLAGTVPFCSFVMERRVEQDVRSAPAEAVTADGSERPTGAVLTASRALA